MKKLFALLLAVIMVLGLVACAQTPADTTPNTTESKPAGDNTTTTEPQVKVEFPLEEEVTLVLTCKPIAKVINLEKNLADNKLWNDLYRQTNVRITIKECADIDTLTSMLQTPNYGDIIMCSGISGMNEKVISDLISTDKLLPLTDYVTNRNIMPNFNERVLDVEPMAKGAFTSPDGEIYVIGSHNEDDSQYLENSIWINKTWLEDADMTIEDLETMDGLEEYLAWVKENDANGDGDANDELPFMCYMSGGGFIESFLGCYGIPTKDATNEGYCFLEDGEVKFAPLTQNWIDFMTRMKKWFDNGWAYEDYLLGHDGDGKPLYEYKQNEYVRDNGKPERIAMLCGTGAPARNAGKKMPEGTKMCEYVSILPPKVEGYETRWYMHPGYMGTKGNIAIAANCKYPEIALAWVDLFYSQEVYLRSNVGEIGTDWVVEAEDGKISSAPLTNDQQAEILETTNNRLRQIFSGFPTAITMKDYETKLTWTAANQKKADALEKYKDVINTEVWPRPYYTREQSETMSEIFTDIALVVKEYRADVLTGKKNLTSDYEEFKSKLKQARIDEYVEIMQEAYEIFLEANK